MTPLGWLALSMMFGIAAMPSVAVARTSGLVLGGRLLTVPRGTRRGRPSAGGRVRAGGVAASAVVVGVVAWSGGVALAVAAATALGVGAVFVRDAVTARRDRARQRELVTAVRVLAGELTAGARPADALDAAATTGRYASELLGAAADAQRTAHDAATALASSDEPGVRALAVAWRLGATTGAALAEVVERVAIDLAARDTRRRAVTVAVAGSRSSAVLLALLPAIGIALGAAMGARPLEFLLTDPPGRLLCCGGVVLDAAGLLWIRRIVTRVQR